MPPKIEGVGLDQRQDWKWSLSKSGLSTVGLSAFCGGKGKGRDAPRIGKWHSGQSCKIGFSLSLAILNDIQKIM